MSSLTSMIASARPAVVRVSGSMSVGELASCPDCIHNGAHFGLEYSTRDGVKSDLRIISGLYPLQGILVERCSQLLIALGGIDEQHSGSELRRNDVHAGSQRNLRHKSRACRTYRRLVQIELGIRECRTPLRHGGILAAD